MILIDDEIPWIEQYLSKYDSVSRFKGRGLTNSDLVESRCTALFVRSTSRVDRQLLENTDVKFVGSATAGIDHVDIKHLHSKKIVFTYAPGSNAVSVTDYVFASISILASRGCINKSLNSLTMCVIGMGNVGSSVVARANKFDMNVIVSDPPLGLDTPLPTLVQASDIITLHIPYTTDGKYPTDNLINDKILAHMKTNCVLINTSRGNVADEHAIVKKCNDHELHTILDVFSHEPLVDNQTIECAQIATPHIAGYTNSAKECGASMVLNGYLTFIGEDPIAIRSEHSQDRTEVIESIDIHFRSRWKLHPSAVVFDELRQAALKMSS